MNVYPSFVVQRRFERLPEDSGEWPRVGIKYRRLPTGTARPGVAHQAVAVAAGIAAWPLPLLLIYAGCWETLLAGLLAIAFPLHIGIVVAFVLGRRADSHMRFMAALFSVFTGVLIGCTVGLVSALLKGASGPDLIMVLVVGAYSVMVCTPSAVAGSYFGGCLMKRLFKHDNDSEQSADLKSAVQNKPHAGAVPYYYPRTQRRPRHG